MNPVTGVRTFGFKSRAAHAERIGEILQSRGVKYFYHPEQDNYRYFNDPAHPELDAVHRIQYVMDNTDPRAVRLGDRHPAQLVGPRALPERDHTPARHQRLGARAGRRAARVGLARQGRLPEHRASGTWVGGPPESGGAPYIQTFLRTPTFTDAIVSGEGDLGAGPPRAPERRSGLPRLQVHVREPGRSPAPVPDRERQRPRPDDRPERRSRPLAAPRQGLRRGAARLRQ